MTIESGRIVTGGRGRYRVDELLGRGGFSEVYSAVCVDSGAPVALKVINLEHRDDVDCFAVEARIMRLLDDHPNVVRLLDHWQDSTVFQNNNNNSNLSNNSNSNLSNSNSSDWKPCTGFLAMELCSAGSIRQRVKEKGALDEPSAASLFRQLLDALAHMHARNVYHGDLKPANILLFCDQTNQSKDPWKEPVLKVADFGLSAQSDGPIFSRSGTDKYLAPEVLSRGGPGYDGAASDMWSCGVVLHVLLTGGALLLPENPTLRTDERCRRLRREDFPPFPLQLSVEVRHLLHRLLDPEPAVRITAAQALRHWWVVAAGAGAVPCFRFDSASPAADVVACFLELLGAAGFECRRTRRRLRACRGSMLVSVDFFPLEAPRIVVEALMLTGCDAEFRQLFTEVLRPGIRQFVLRFRNVCLGSRSAAAAAT